MTHRHTVNPAASPGPARSCRRTGSRHHVALVTVLLSTALWAPNAPPALAAGGAPAFTDSWQAMVRRDGTVRGQIGLLDVGVGWTAVRLTDEVADLGLSYAPPEPAGAIGPDHFMLLLNGSATVFTRTGTVVPGTRVSLDTFFALSAGGVNYPRNGAFTPRVLYDRPSGRWFACALERGDPIRTANHLILAVSRTSDPTGVWDKYLLSVGLPTDDNNSYFTGYDTLGIDGAGVYFGMRIFPSNSANFAQIAATPKAPLLAASPSLGAVTTWGSISDMFSTPVPARNLSQAPADNFAWVVASSPYDLSGLTYRAIVWAGDTPSLSSTFTLSTPPFGLTVNAPALGSATPVFVRDMRIQSVVYRGGRLWACRNVGLNAAGGAASPDRTGVEWFEIDTTTPTPTVVQQGRVFDPAATAPAFFFFPSVTPNGQGHAAMGFAGSSESTHVGAYYTYRLATAPAGAMQGPVLLKAGAAPYEILDDAGRNRWGNYSSTTLDPNDDMTIWTVQAYAGSPANTWATWVAALRAPAPTLVSPAANAAAGQTGVTLNLAGTGFHDPGPGFRNRLVVQLQGGAPNGIGNYQVTFNGPTSITLRFDIAPDASSGPRDIAVTNPDGQTATAIGGFTVTGGQALATDLAVASASGAVGETVALTATLTRRDTGQGIPGKTVTFTVDGTGFDRATNAQGVATLLYAIPEGGGAGDRTVQASFAGDAAFLTASGSGTLTVSRAATISWIGARTGLASRHVYFWGYLKRESGLVPLVGRTVHLAVAGQRVDTSATDQDGRALLRYNIPVGTPPGDRVVASEFEGDTAYLASSDTNVLTVQVETRSWIGDRTIPAGKKVGFWGYLHRRDNNATIPGMTMHLVLFGQRVATAVTGADGRALLVYTVPPGTTPGAYTARVEFDDGGGYLPSFGTSTLTVTGP
ncbi:MAG: Ig-like domain repeat protein [Chthonomonadales bacterium]|nr:Ig-like domain repeat protein [Chthonomonadales bacterium]